MSARPLKIVTVSTTDRGGGAERVARELHEAYAAAGADAWLAVGARHGNEARTVELPNAASRGAWTRAWTRAAGALPQRGAAFHAARAMRGAIAGPARWMATRRGEEDFDFPGTGALLDPGIGGSPPDVFHLHNLHGGYFDLRRLPEIGARAPTILTLHDAWLLSGHCSHSFGCPRWETGCGKCPALWIHPAVPQDATAFNWERKRDIFARSALHIATPCAWLADLVRRSMLMPAAREVRVIPYGVNLDIFRAGDKRAARIALGLDPDRPTLLTFANSFRFPSWKDSEQFRGAMARLDGAAADAQWVALGESGPDESVGAVRIRRAGIERDDRRLALWYQAADAYVHPARADTFPNMVLESLACGTPVIATAVCGIPEQVTSAAGLAGARGPDASFDAATGALVRPGDAAALADTLSAFVALDASRRAALSANAARDARLRFDRDRHSRDYLAWARELAAGQGPTGRA